MINLLPEELRRREQKELQRAARRPKIFEIELTNPAKVRPADLASDQPKKFWWQKIFGTAPKKPAATLKPALVLPLKSSAIKLDLLSSAKTQKIKYQQQEKKEKPSKINQSFWRWLFGPPRSPIRALDAAQSAPAKIMGEARKIQSAGGSVLPLPAKKSIHWFSFRRRPKRHLIFTGSPKITPKLAEAAPKLMPAGSAFKLKPEKAILVEEKLVKPLPSRKINWRQKLMLLLKGRQKSAAGLPWPPLKAKSKPVATAKEKAKYHLAPKLAKSGLDINLIPEELLARKYLGVKGQVAALFLAVILPFLAVTAVYYLIDYYQQQIDQQIKNSQQLVNQLNQELSGFQEIQQKNFLLQQKLLALDTLFNGQIRWTNFFNLLEKYTLAEVYYTNFTADISGEFVLPAVATNYQKAAQQIVALKSAKDFVKKVGVDNLRLYSTSKAGIIGVAFELKLVLADDVFIKK